MMFVHHSPLSQIDVVALLGIWHGSKMTGPCWIQQNENGSFEVPLEEPLTISAIGSPGQSFYTYQFPLEMPLLIKLKVWAGMLVKHKKRTWTPQEYNNTSPFCGILLCLPVRTVWGPGFVQGISRVQIFKTSPSARKISAQKKVLHFAAFQPVYQQLWSLVPRAQVAHPAWHLKKGYRDSCLSGRWPVERRR